MSIGRRLISQGTERQVKHVRPVPRSASPLLTRVYDQVERDIDVVLPPFLLHSPAPGTLAGHWTLFRETMLASGVTSRRVREAVAAAVSLANLCPYCVDVHSTGLYELADADEAEALAGDRPQELADSRVRELVGWARHAHRRAHPPPGVTGAAAAELVGVLVAFHYLNRMVNVFLINPLLPARLQGSTRRRVKDGLSRLLRPMLRREYPPGASLALLPDRPLPADAGWAQASPRVAAAVARAAAVFEAAGESAVPEPVREMVEARLDRWEGEQIELGDNSLADAVARVPAEERPAARLALLTALASYRVDEHVVAAFREVRPDDAALVATTAWASFAVARRVGGRISAASASGRD